MREVGYLHNIVIYRALDRTCYLVFESVRMLVVCWSELANG